MIWRHPTYMWNVDCKTYDSDNSQLDASHHQNNHNQSVSLVKSLNTNVIHIELELVE